jgi:hypothetical protein
MRPVETIPGIEGRGKENDARGEINSDKLKNNNKNKVLNKTRTF